MLYYKRDRFRLLSGGRALGNLSHAMPVSRYWHSSPADLCHMADIGTVFPLICPLKMQQTHIKLNSLGQPALARIRNSEWPVSFVQ